MNIRNLRKHFIKPVMFPIRKLIRIFLCALIFVTIFVVTLITEGTHTSSDEEFLAKQKAVPTLSTVSMKNTELMTMRTVSQIPITIETTEEVAEPEPEYIYETMYVVEDTDLCQSILDGNDIGPALCTVPINTVLEVKYLDGDVFYTTKYNNQSGYIDSKYLAPYDPELHIEIGLDYKYQDLVRQMIDMLDLNTDEYFFYGMMYTESRFRVLSESYAGAQGIMQIMPSTWKTYYKMFCQEYPDFSQTIVNDPYDLRSNIVIGIYIVYDISGGDVANYEHKTLTTYNRGENNASKYYRTNGTYISDYSEDILRAAEYIREHNTWKEGL